MANSINRVIIVGNLGKDPEIKHFENGGAVTRFPVATTESYRDRETNEWKDAPTDWHNISIRSKGLAEWVANNLKKGQQVSLEGKLRYRNYEKDGQTMYFTEIHVDNLVLPPKSDGAAAPAQASSGSQQSSPPVAEDPADDLPF